MYPPNTPFSRKYPESATEQTKPNAPPIAPEKLVQVADMVQMIRNTVGSPARVGNPDPAEKEQAVFKGLQPDADAYAVLRSALELSTDRKLMEKVRDAFADQMGEQRIRANGDSFYVVESLRDEGIRESTAAFDKMFGTSNGPVGPKSAVNGPNGGMRLPNVGKPVTAPTGPQTATFGNGTKPPTGPTTSNVNPPNAIQKNLVKPLLQTTSDVKPPNPVQKSSVQQTATFGNVANSGRPTIPAKPPETVHGAPQATTFGNVANSGRPPIPARPPQTVDGASQTPTLGNATNSGRPPIPAKTLETVKSTVPSKAQGVLGQASTVPTIAERMGKLNLNQVGPAFKK
ncbi:MAG: hypothetical protein ABSB70_04520 [Candidatus Velthaea sp.]|jgi:hypothetical protein